MANYWNNNNNNNLPDYSEQQAQNMEISPETIVYDPDTDFYGIDNVTTINDFNDLTNVFELIGEPDTAQTLSSCSSSSSPRSTTISSQAPLEVQNPNDFIRDIKAVQNSISITENKLFSSDNHPSPGTSGYQSTSPVHHYYDSGRNSSDNSGPESPIYNHNSLPTYKEFNQPTLYYTKIEECQSHFSSSFTKPRQTNHFMTQSRPTIEIGHHQEINGLFDQCFPGTNDDHDFITTNSLTTQSNQRGHVSHVTRTSTSSGKITSSTNNEKQKVESMDKNNNKDKTTQSRKRKKSGGSSGVEVARKERRKETNRKASAKYREKQEKQKKDQETMKLQSEQIFREHEKKNCVLKANVDLLTDQLIKAIRSVKNKS